MRVVKLLEPLALNLFRLHERTVLTSTKTTAHDLVHVWFAYHLNEQAAKEMIGIQCSELGLTFAASLSSGVISI